MLVSRLSKREKEIAILVSKGLTNKEIASKIGISERRVGEIVYNIKEKWSIVSRVEIGILTYHLKLINIDYLIQK
ncbi:hypothetical protein BMG_6070 (plasmid) [Priestia megaterium]|uniref:response regulator transcription factor n=1 Tax=Priestia megaterium TaxID=1404 RepID=UPI0015DC76B2|nr:helix-turn-helix transcriptional regulator [Priestia megaterium]QLK09298.1 hypothetical protein BMG_6070 [Priestia megaterium]WJD83664.1 helix-turn-helix transcriptional regulator [Priestia megaterium]